MDLREIAAAKAAADQGERPAVTLQGDRGDAVSKVYDEATATNLTHDDLLRGWRLDPNEWAIVDGSLVVNRWMVSSFDRKGCTFVETWNYQYKARLRRRVELDFATLPTAPVGCGRCAGRKAAKATRASEWAGMRHVIIPDTQVKPGVPTDHLVWVGRWIAEHCTGKPTRIVHLGDHWDMPSLSSYDHGKAAAERRRVMDDLAAGNRAFAVLDAAMGDDPMWDKHFLFGNHEDRITRYVNDNAELAGFLGLEHCVTPAGWQRHGYLEPVVLDGIVYAHYFYAPNTGKPYGGENIEARIRTVGHSFVMGHQQGRKIGETMALGKSRIGVVAGSCYQHDEDYKGPQGNGHWRGIVVLNDVEDGTAEPMSLQLDYLCRRYAGHRLSEHTGVTL